MSLRIITIFEKIYFIMIRILALLLTLVGMAGLIMGVLGIFGVKKVDNINHLLISNKYLWKIKYWGSIS